MTTERHLTDGRVRLADSKPKEAKRKYLATPATPPEVTERRAVEAEARERHHREAYVLESRAARSLRRRGAEYPLAYSLTVIADWAARHPELAAHELKLRRVIAQGPPVPKYDPVNCTSEADGYDHFRSVAFSGERPGGG